MPEISSFYGIIISMFFSDHNPPHFHVKYQGYEATIDIANGTVKGQLPRRALNMVYEWLDQHKDDSEDCSTHLSKADSGFHRSREELYNVVLCYDADSWHRQ